MKSLCRACVRAALSNPALLCVIQRLSENGEELAFSKYAQCINNACPCAAELGKGFAGLQDLKDIGMKDTNLYI